MYQKITSEFGTTIFLDYDGLRLSFVDPSPGNSDWEAYQAWLAEGNEPEVIDNTASAE